jgi:serine/threonine protein kinase
MVAAVHMCNILLFPDTPLHASISCLKYMAPEVLLCATRLSPAADVYSVGCILGEMLLHTNNKSNNAATSSTTIDSGSYGTYSSKKWPLSKAILSDKASEAITQQVSMLSLLHYTIKMQLFRKWCRSKAHTLINNITMHTHCLTSQ